MSSSYCLLANTGSSGEQFALHCRTLPEWNMNSGRTENLASCCTWLSPAVPETRPASASQRNTKRITALRPLLPELEFKTPGPPLPHRRQPDLPQPPRTWRLPIHRLPPFQFDDRGRSSFLPGSVPPESTLPGIGMPGGLLVGTRLPVKEGPGIVPVLLPTGTIRNGNGPANSLLQQRQIGEQQSCCLPLATEPNAARNECSGWAWLVPEGRQPHESIGRPALPYPACSPRSANAGFCLETGCQSRIQCPKMPQPPLALRVAPGPTHGTVRVQSRHISSAHAPKSNAGRLKSPRRPPSRTGLMAGPGEDWFPANPGAGVRAMHAGSAFPICRLSCLSASPAPCTCEYCP